MDPAQYVWEGDETVLVLGQETGQATAGEAYTMHIQFSRQFTAEYQGRALPPGRLQLRTFTVYFSGTAFFRTEVSPYGAATAPNFDTFVPAQLADFTRKLIGNTDL